MNADHDELTRAIAEALHEEARHAMSTTNTPEQLEGFRRRIDENAPRHRLYQALTAVAATVVVGAAVFSAVRSTDHGGSAHQPTGPVATDAAISPAPASVPAPIAALKEPSGPSPVATASPLAGGVPTTRVIGPGVLGVSAFGSIWGVAESSSAGAADGVGHIYRIDASGRAVGATAYAGPAADVPPFQAGRAVLIASTPVGNPASYLAFDSSGNQIGSIPVATAGVGAGDATGGWAQSASDALIQIDASGTKVVKTVVLPGTTISGVAIGGGSVWVADQAKDDVLRIDPSTGAVLGAAPVGPSTNPVVPATPLEVAYSNGAVFVSSQDYELRRIHVATMTVTALTSAPYADAYFLFTVAPDGDIWAEPAQGVVDDLDPTTLATKRAVQVLPTTEDDNDFGAVVSTDRVFMADGTGVRSFPSG